LEEVVELSKRFGLALLVALLALLAYSANRAVSPAAAAVEVEISLSDDELECGDDITITAEVSDNGSDVPDGTAVTFTIGGQIVAVVETEDGEASIKFEAPIGFVGPLNVSASVGAASDSVLLSVVCVESGPPATLQLAVTPATLICGNQASVLATVRDAQGRPVANGTMVDFTATSGGSIVPSAPTISGLATSVFTLFTGTSGGTVQITARVRGTNISSTAVIQALCPGAPSPTVQPAPTLPPPVVVPPPTGITPPSTGDAGLAR
jgi:hypothetical protein